MQDVQVFCQQEQRIIGDLPLPAAGQVLDALWVWRNYRPRASEYTLRSTRTMDNEYFLCPHCTGNVTLDGPNVMHALTDVVKGDLPNAPPISRETLRAKIVADLSGGFHEHVASGAAQQDAGPPFVLGTLKVREGR